MEIKIGIKSVAREIRLDMTEDYKQLNQLLQPAMQNSEILDLTDKHGTHYLINAAEIAYVEFAAENQIRIGFAL